MKVDPNAPAYPCVEHFGDYGIPPASHTGIPIRLAIAAQIMAALAGSQMRLDFSKEDDASYALKCADALIAAHNEGAK